LQTFKVFKKKIKNKNKKIFKEKENFIPIYDGERMVKIFLSSLVIGKI